MSKKCCLCKSSKNNELLYGEFLKNGNVGVHYYCLLLTSNLAQHGEDNEGILGFLIKDIKQEIKRISVQTCYFCCKKGANVSCCDKKCKRSFHLPCGVNKCLFHFVGTFQSFCEKHIKISSPKEIHDESHMCTICFEEMGKYNILTSIQSACCKSGWFHKECIARFAKNAGYFFKCPLCNNEKKFRSDIVKKGIFVPDQDAAWELEPNAYAELLERPDSCEADMCICKYGRKYKNSKWSLINCVMCGSHCIHQLCSGNYTKSYKCPTCCKIPDKEISKNNDSEEEEVIDIENVCSKNTIEISDSDCDDNNDEKYNNFLSQSVCIPNRNLRKSSGVPSSSSLGISVSACSESSASSETSASSSSLGCFESSSESLVSWLSSSNQPSSSYQRYPKRSLRQKKVDYTMMLNIKRVKENAIVNSSESSFASCTRPKRSLSLSSEQSFSSENSKKIINRKRIRTESLSSDSSKESITMIKNAETLKTIHSEIVSNDNKISEEQKKRLEKHTTETIHEDNELKPKIFLTLQQFQSPMKGMKRKRNVSNSNKKCNSNQTSNSAAFMHKFLNLTPSPKDSSISKSANKSENHLPGEFEKHKSRSEIRKLNFNLVDNNFMKDRNIFSQMQIDNYFQSILPSSHPKYS